MPVARRSLPAARFARVILFCHASHENRKHQGYDYATVDQQFDNAAFKFLGGFADGQRQGGTNRKNVSDGCDDADDQESTELVEAGVEPGNNGPRNLQDDDYKQNVIDGLEHAVWVEGRGGYKSLNSENYCSKSDQEQ